MRSSVRSSTTLAVALAALSTAACSPSSTPTPDSAAQRDTAPNRARAAPDSIATIDGVRVRLTTSAWRDFMPSPQGAAGSELMVNLQLASNDSTPFPAGLTIDSVWVLSDGDTWATSPTRESRPEIPNGIDLMLRGGPRWDPGRQLDVRARVRPRAGAPVVLGSRTRIQRVS